MKAKTRTNQPVTGVVEDVVSSAETGTINKVLGIDTNGKLVKGDVSGGTKLYNHNIQVGGEIIEIISTMETPYTYNQLNDVLMGNDGVLTILDYSNNVTLIQSLSLSGGILRGAYVNQAYEPIVYNNTGFSDTVTPL